MTLVACNSSILLSTEVPAKLVGSTKAIRAEVKSAMSTLLQQDSIIIADDAFEKRSVLVLERLPYKDAQGNRIQEREMATPERIQLLLKGGKCVLKRLSNDTYIELKTAQCVAE